MVSRARRKLVRRGRKAVFHCSNRCVRRAFLCGPDKVSNRDYSYRRDWIIQREEQLAQLFALEIEFRAEMSNHLHLVLRTRPEIARRWSREEVARRWLTATKLAKSFSDEMPRPDPENIQALLKNKKELEKKRRRLSDPSWFMGILCENIARRANQEDGVKGRFWESRFKCRECTDENSILICGIYVDLNPIRAGEATSPQDARYTSLFQRLMAQTQRKNARDRLDGWLGKLTLEPEKKSDESSAYKSYSGRRASDQGLLPISLDEYLRLVIWTAEQLRTGNRSTIPQDIEGILEKIELNQEAWLDTIADYDGLFCHVVGSPKSIAKVAKRMGASRLKGTTAGRRVFG